MGLENGDALEGLFNVDATERAGYQMADAGTDRFERNIRELTPTNHDPWNADPLRPPGTLRASWFRVKVPLGSAPLGEMPSGLVKRRKGKFTVWRGTVATFDPVVGFVEDDTRPHTIEPRADRAPASIVETRRLRGTVQDGRAHLAWRGPGGMIFAKKVEHPGTQGAHMQTRGAMKTERDVRSWSAPALRWWLVNVSKGSKP